jgi:hypothetical protein
MAAGSVGELNSFRLLQQQTANQSRNNPEKTYDAGGVRQFCARATSRHYVGERRCDEHGRNTEHSAADVRRKTLSSTAQTRRIDSGQVISPKTVKPVEKQCGEKNPNVDEGQASCRGEKVEPRENKYGRSENETQSAALRNNPHDEQRKKQAARQTTQLLKELHSKVGSVYDTSQKNLIIAKEY